MRTLPMHKRTRRNEGKRQVKKDARKPRWFVGWADFFFANTGIQQP